MKHIYILIILNVWFTAFSQSNLVPNPSFENQLFCDSSAIASNLGDGVLMDWYNPNTCTPDYFNNCWMIPPPKIRTTKLLMGMGL